MKNAILLFVCLISVKAFAEDIELYVKHNIDIDEKPRVMLIFDTSGSMAFSSRTGRSCGYDYSRRRYRLCSDSRLGVAKNAITDLVNKNPDIDFGLMRFNGSSGGYVLARIGAAQSTVKSQINNLVANGATPLSETLWEAYLYLTGGSRYYSRNVRGRDTSIESGNSYLSPFRQVAGEPERCDNAVNIILMTDGDPSNDSQQNGNIRSLHQNRFGSSAPVYNGNYMPALAKSIYGDSNTIVDLYPTTSTKEDTGRVYTIGFGNGMSSSGKNILQKTADLGGGQYLQANTSSQLSDALNSVTNSIRQEADSFALPVAANTGNQTKSSDSLYYTMFLPETHTTWKGNLKKLKVKNNTTLVDMGGKAAIDKDGKIDKNATTFWSEPGSKDGNAVDKGGVNYQLSRQTTRNIYSDFGTASLHNFTYSTAFTQYGNNLETFTDKMNAPASELASIMQWARGIDVNDEDRDSNRNERRQTIFGDPLHSKVVSINYGTEESPNIRLLVGTNAGFMHMFKDNGDTMTESWAFIPERLLPVLKGQKDKKADTKLYGVDGPSTLYHDDKDGDNLVSSGDSVWLFFGLRRGGNQYYALDITNPDSPKLMWGGPITGGTGDFEMLGQTWAKPLVTHIEMEGDDPVVIFSAGYDTNKDNVSKTNDSLGQGVYIVKALTGELVWSLTRKNGFTGKHSIAGSATTLDSNYDGYDDRIYMADTGGGVWRIDMPGPNPSNGSEPWTHFKLAQLGGNNASSDRRFYSAPMVARTYFSKVSITESSSNNIKTRKDTPYEAILLGSGNRTRPASSAAIDYLFMIRDENSVTKSFEDDDIPQPIKIGDLFNVTQDPFSKQLNDLDKFTDLEAELGSFQGWKYKLSASEKSLSEASVAGGVAYYTSFSPPGTSNKCEVEAGSGKLYAFHLHYGTKIYNQLSFATQTAVPEAPQPYFTCKVSSNTSGTYESNSCSTEIKMIGPVLTSTPNADLDLGEDGIFDTVEIADPVPRMGDGSIDLVDGEFGLQTKQLYIYKREENDEK
ncbi:type IV pilus assembly protein PilY1 [Pseudoalteromonas citrea]|uniref:Type IV pilus assembly protein PilY1 n=2 Tax=Pseudoalteromonas citrea TaxID=43655 RepID=A0AAD4AL63_9GAMM|nr:PilC/PilY family type IV pilus protein [Pseudoalteromonas citrea]KAF7774261.1 type IV pilus assembly protein PilY1 [Pseudoalteromonas citrea]